MPLTPEELLDAIAVLKRDKPAGWRALARSYIADLRDLTDPDDPESRDTMSDFPERVGRRYFPVGRGLVPFWRKPMPAPEYAPHTIFHV